MSERYGTKRIQLMKWTLLVCSVVSMIVLGSAAYLENFRGEWRLRQRAYRALLIETAHDDASHQAASSFTVAQKQIYLGALDRIDRCTTCHLGVENPAMTGAAAPFGSHPGDLLKHHPTERFGCSVCHQGQGRAVFKSAAHGWHEDGRPVAHVERPLLRDQMVYTSCGRCHAEVDLYGGEADLFAEDTDGEGAGGPIDGTFLFASLPGASALAEGKQLVVERGCLGCHKYRGRGGVLGPELTYVGDKTRHDFDFSHVEGEHTVAQWLFEHFKYPKNVSPSTLMPDMGLTDEQARHLAVYMMSLHRKSAPKGYQPVARSGTDGARSVIDGSTLYHMFCSACHGADGFGSTMRAGLWPRDLDPWGHGWEASDVVIERRNQFELMVPSLNHPDTLAVAGDDYLRRMIAGGRPGTNMIGWQMGEGGLSADEIDKLVAHIRAWQGAGPPKGSVSTARGNPRFGRALYRSRCVGCHGRHGEGGIGVALNAPSFLAVASDTFLRDTIVKGRANTAMPSWKQLSADEVSDLIAFLRRWQAGGPDQAQVLSRLSKEKPPGRRSLRIGKILYRAHCADCHGAKAEGALGPSLRTDEFLSLVDDAYLYTAIVEGRPGTAMPAWKHPSVDDLVDLIGYIRSFNGHTRRTLEPFAAHGDWDRGRILFEESCAGCHGRSVEGGTGPQLSNSVFLGSVTDAMLQAWIRFGKLGTPMRSFLRGTQGLTDLSAAQIEDIVTFLRRFELRPEIARARPGLGLVERGAEVYAAACVSCHGANGEGSTGSALSNADFLAAGSDGFLKATIILGRDGTEMRAMGRAGQGTIELSADEVSDVVAFIRSWESARPMDDLPQRYVIGADLDMGKELFAGHCAGCHGANGNDGWAPALNSKKFLAAATDGFLQATIAIGRSNTAMRAFGRGGGGVTELSGEQIDCIVAFIRTWAVPQNRPAAAPDQGGEEPQRVSLLD